jgi:hypothetical protein
MRITWRHRFLTAALLGAGALPAYAAPSAPTLAFPENARLTSDKTPSLDWTDVSGATYTLQVSATDDFSSLTVSSPAMTASSYTLTAPEALTRGTTYYWRVRSGDASGESAFSSTRSFTVSLNRITYAVEIDSTAPLATPLTFSTSVVSSDRVTPTAGQFALGPFDLTPQTTHYWRVKARDDGGNESAFTSEFKFNTYPKVLTLTPADGATLNAPTPLFDWTDAAWASSYTLEVSLYADFSTLKISSAGLSSSQYQSSIADALTNNTTFYWRARAVNGANVSVSSAAAFFLDLERPVLSSPPNQANVRTRVPLLDWTSVAWAGAYNLQVSSQSNFSVLKISSSGAASSQYLVTSADALNDKTTYYWHVQAASGTVTSAYTSTSSFYLEIVSTAALVFPENARLTSDKTPSFQWDLPSSTHDLTFTLEWADNAAMSPLLSSQAGLTTGAYTLNGAGPQSLTRGSTYYWRVKTLVNDYNGANTLTSSTRSFTVSLNRITYAVEIDSTAPLAAPLTFSTSVVSSDRVTPTANQHTLTSSQALDKGSTYYWRIRADDDGGNIGAFSSTYSFVIPGITKPTFGPVGALSFTVNWTSTFPPGTTTYYAEISTMSNFSPVSATSATMNFFANFTGLTMGSTYYARVSTNAATGPYSNTGSTRTLPGVPLLLYPELAPISDRTPTVRWSTSGPAGNVDYTLAWADNIGMSPLLFSQTAISTDNYTLSGAGAQLLSRGSTYYWRITATDLVTGNTAVSAVRKLKVVINRIAYDLEVSAASGMTPLHISTQVLAAGLLLPTTNVYTVPAAESLSLGTTYHWRVRAQDMAGNLSVFASSNSFFVDLYLPAIATPTFSAVTTAGLTVNWTSGTPSGYNPAGTNYNVRISTAQNFSPILKNIETTNLTAAFTGLPSATTYYAQVAAFEGASTTTYTNLGSTRTLPATPLQLYPELAPISDRTPTVRWSTSGPAGNVDYTLAWADNIGMSPLLFSQTAISTDNYTLSGAGAQLLSRGSTYYWRITATDLVTGNTAVSAVRKLKVVINRIAYDLEVSAASGMTPLHISTQVLAAGLLLPTTNVYTVPAAESLSLGTTYHWRVRAQDMAGNLSVFASSQNFIVPCDPATSAASGLWSNASTWSTGIVPESCTAVTIAAGHVVTLDAMTATSSNTVINGTLKASRTVSSSWTLVQGDLNVNAGGTLDYGNEADPIPTAVNAHLILAYGAVAGQYGLIVNNGGNFTVRGSTKTPYGYATASIAASGTSLTISASSATNWAVGDTITIGPTSGQGSGTTEARAVTSITGADPLTISWAAGLAGARVLTATSPIIVANLTRNTLVRSSSTYSQSRQAYIRNLVQNTTSFALAHGEFAYLGLDAASKYGITFDGSGVKGAISSSTIRDGHNGLRLIGVSGTRHDHNLIYNMQGLAAIQLDSSSGNIFTGNHAFVNATYGYYLRAGSNQNDFIGNFAYSGNHYGIILNGANNLLLKGNRTFCGSQPGFQLTGSNQTMIDHLSYSNANGGGQAGAQNSTLLGNKFYSNLAHGLSGSSVSNLLFVGNEFSNNMTDGAFFTFGANNATWIANNIFSNAGKGVSMSASFGHVFVDTVLGYDNAGNSAPNGLELDIPSADTGNFTFRNSRINPANGIDLTSFNDSSSYILSYAQDYDTGTVRLWGNYTLSGSTLTLDYSAQLYDSKATTPKLMRGSGHSVSISTDTVSGPNALSQLITIEYRGAQWHVDGSSSGADMRVFTGNQANLPIPAALPQFYLTLTQGGPAEGDRLDFALLAASKDQNTQKRLLFGPSASTFNQGRSKLAVASSGGLVLKGKSDGTANTLIDMFASGSTYYTLVASGAFTAAYSSFTNADPGGLQLSGSAGVSISSSTFDFLGFASGTNTYITARDLTSNATFDNVTFGLSRSSFSYASAYNVRVEGSDANLRWTFTTPVGPLWGEAYDSDPNNYVIWGRRRLKVILIR